MSAKKPAVKAAKSHKSPAAGQRPVAPEKRAAKPSGKAVAPKAPAKSTVTAAKKPATKAPVATKTSPATKSPSAAPKAVPRFLAISAANAGLALPVKIMKSGVEAGCMFVPAISKQD